MKKREPLRRKGRRGAAEEETNEITENEIKD